ncbi:MAG: hypothetical protein OER88_06060 [Planctomycetota bacterium]|nr:hypothetical protein [Planctomycetota bacterium]
MWGNTLGNITRATRSFVRRPKRRRCGHRAIERGTLLHMPFAGHGKRPQTGGWPAGILVFGGRGIIAGLIGMTVLGKQSWGLTHLFTFIAFATCMVLALSAWTARLRLGPRIVATLMCLAFPALCVVHLVT